jgi:hypothetical protein
MSMIHLRVQRSRTRWALLAGRNSANCVSAASVVFLRYVVNYIDRVNVSFCQSSDERRLRI